MAIWWNVQGGSSRKFLVSKYYSTIFGIAVPDPVVPWPRSSITITGTVPPGMGVSHGNLTSDQNRYSLSGTPTVTGVFTFSGYVTSLADGSTTSIGTYTISICSGHLNRKSTGHLVRNAAKHLVIGGSGSSGTTPLDITNVALPNVVYGASYVVQMAATGGTTPYTWSVASGSFPSGISMSSSGRISGSSTAAAGSYTVTLRCSDTSSQSTTKQFTFSMLPNLSTNVCIELRQLNADVSLCLMVRDPANYQYFTPLCGYLTAMGYPSVLPPYAGLVDDYSNNTTPNGGTTSNTPTPASSFTEQVYWLGGNSPSGIYKFWFYHSGGNDSTLFRFRIYTNGNQTPFWEYSNYVSTEVNGSPYYPYTRPRTFNSTTGIVS